MYCLFWCQLDVEHRYRCAKNIMNIMTHGKNIYIYMYIYICMYVCNDTCQEYIYIYIYIMTHGQNIYIYIYIYIYNDTRQEYIYIYIYIMSHDKNIYIYIYIYSCIARFRVHDEPLWSENIFKTTFISSTSQNLRILTL